MHIRSKKFVILHVILSLETDLLRAFKRSKKFDFFVSYHKLIFYLSAFKRSLRFHSFLCMYLKAYVKQEQGNLLELMDPSLGPNYSKKEALNMLNLALLCANQSPSLRPTMSAVVSMLEGKIQVQAPTVNYSSVAQNDRFKAFGKLALDRQIDSDLYSIDSQPAGSSTDGPWMDSSVSLQSKDDHIHLDTSKSKKLLDHHGDVILE